MKIVQLFAVFCLVSAVAYSAPVDTEDFAAQLLQSAGVTVDMSPADIRLKVKEFTKDLQSGVDALDKLVAGLNEDQLKPHIAQAEQKIDDIRANLNDSNRDQSLMAARVLFSDMKIWLFQTLPQLGFDFNKVSPQFVTTVIFELNTAFEADLARFQRETIDLTPAQLREKIRKEFETVEMGIENVSGWLDDIVQVTEDVREAIDTVLASASVPNYAAVKSGLETALKDIDLIALVE